MSHGPSREVMHVRQQLWRDACTATLKPFRLAVPFAELRVFLCSGVSACRRSGVMSRQCCLCMATQNLDQFPQRGGRRCRRCAATTERMRRHAGSCGYRMSFLATTQEDRHLQDLTHAFENDPNFTFPSYFGTILSDDAIRARQARSAADDSDPSSAAASLRAVDPSSAAPFFRPLLRTSQPGSPPSSPSGQNAFGPMRVRVHIDATGPFSATVSGGHRDESCGRSSSPTS